MRDFSGIDECCCAYNPQSPTGTIQVPLTPLQQPAPLQPAQRYRDCSAGLTINLENKGRQPGKPAVQPESRIETSYHHCLARTNFAPAYAVHPSCRNQVAPQWQILPQRAHYPYRRQIRHATPKSLTKIMGTSTSTKQHAEASQAQKNEQAAATQSSGSQSHELESRCGGNQFPDVHAFLSPFMRCMESEKE